MNGSSQQPIGGGKITTIVGRIVFILMGAMGLVAAHGQTFTDDFNDNAFDPAKWGSAVNVGAGRLFEQNQRVDFISTSSTGDENSSMRQWVGQLPVTSNWEATVQIHNALNAAGGATNKWGSIGLQLRRPGNTNEYLFIELFSRYASATTTDRGVYTSLQTPTVTYDDLEPVYLDTTDVFLKMSYDADTGILTTSYDRDASGTAYGWRPLGAFDLSGAGRGGSANRNWGVSAGTPFTLHISGYSRATTIPTGAIWADNFNLTILPATPTPTIVTVADNFNDNVVDPTKWGADVNSGNGRLFEQNARVDYRVATASAGGFDEATRPWIAQLPIDSDWAATVDVHNEFNPAVGHYGAVGIRLRRAGSGAEEILFEHYAAGGADTVGAGFFTSLQNSQTFFGDTFHEYDTFDGSLKMTFSAATKVVELSFDRDGPASGYGWQPLASFGLGGSGGGLGNRDWALSNAQKFSLLLYGYSELGSITNGLLWLDNFSVNIVQTSQPQLAVVRQGTTVKITWPSSATGYTLQMKNDLNAAAWTNLATPTVPNGSIFEAIVNVTAQNQLFRLQKL